MLTQISHRRKSSPVSSHWIRSHPGVTFSLNMYPHTLHTHLPTHILSKSHIHNGFSMEIKVIDIDSEHYTRRVVTRAREESTHSTSSHTHTSPLPTRTRKRIAPTYVSYASFPHIAPAAGPVNGSGDEESKLSQSGLTHRDAVDMILMNGLSLSKPLPGLCQICAVRKTGQWRRGPHGPRTLCNVSISLNG